VQCDECQSHLAGQVARTTPRAQRASFGTNELLRGAERCRNRVLITTSRRSYAAGLRLGRPSAIVHCVANVNARPSSGPEPPPAITADLVAALGTFAHARVRRLVLPGTSHKRPRAGILCALAAASAIPSSDTRAASPTRRYRSPAVLVTLVSGTGSVCWWRRRRSRRRCRSAPV
jgi:hypothetical protein